MIESGYSQSFLVNFGRFPSRISDAAKMDRCSCSRAVYCDPTVTGRAPPEDEELAGRFGAPAVVAVEEGGAGLATDAAAAVDEDLVESTSRRLFPPGTPNDMPMISDTRLYPPVPNTAPNVRSSQLNTASSSERALKCTACA